jgi:hypothetical protein
VVDVTCLSAADVVAVADPLWAAVVDVAACFSAAAVGAVADLFWAAVVVVPARAGYS